MSDRHVVATTMLIAGIMLGAFTVQLKDHVSLRRLRYNNAMRCNGAVKHGRITGNRSSQHAPRVLTIAPVSPRTIACGNFF
jgi:hypothetical protein